MCLCLTQVSQQGWFVLSMYLWIYCIHVESTTFPDSINWWVSERRQYCMHIGGGVGRFAEGMLLCEMLAFLKDKQTSVSAKRFTNERNACRLIHVMSFLSMAVISSTV